MERELRKFATTGGHVIEMKTFLTLGEMDSIQDELAGGMKVDVKSDGQIGAPSFDGSVMKKARNAAISVVVVSVDGASENILENFLALPAKDATEALVEIDKVNDGLGDEKKA